jgi:hypothetical protein
LRRLENKPSDINRAEETGSDMKKLAFVLLSLLLSSSVFAANYRQEFTPAPGVRAVVDTNDGSLNWKIYYKGGSSWGTESLDTEKAVRIAVDDYDFSGHLGFSVGHVDDGMGTYTIHRVFTYSPSARRFVERSPAPSCGDEFINLQVDKKNRRLISTMWDQNVPESCTTRLSIVR